MLRVKGVASLTETITLVEGLPGRLLARSDGERRLTDLRHVGQLLHAAATAEQLGVTALTAWLRQRIAEAEEETGDEERSRRLESDAEAVQVLTIHRSKGLEFPIVYLPYLWEPAWIGRDDQPVFFHDPDAGDARTIDVALDGPDFPRHAHQHLVEQRGEDLRLAYVALTRARHQAVVWWAGSWDSRDSALWRLLFARAEDGTVAPKGAATPTDLAAVTRLRALAGARAGADQRRARDARRAQPLGGARRRAGRARGGRVRRAISTGAGGARRSPTSPPAPTRRASASEPEEALLEDEPDTPPPGAPAADDDTRRCARRRPAWTPCRSAFASARSCTACSRRPTSRLRTSTPSSATTWRRRWPAAAWTSATRRTSWRASPRRSRRRSGRWSATSACATCSGATGSTS